MTVLNVSTVADGIRIGDPPEHPELAGVVEARGGLLLCDELSDGRYPAAILHDPDRAADWLWDVYGHSAASAVLSGETVIEADGDSPVLAAVCELAHLNWARAWWPVSAIAGVPRLPSALLRAETAVATAAVEHLLDDEDAIARALSDVDLDGLRGRPATAPLPEEIALLAERVTELAEDHGVTFAAPDGHREETGWTLAAGGEPAAAKVVLRSGSSGISWALLRPDQLDAAATVEWAVVRDHGRTLLSVSVPAVPGPWRDPGPLRARLGDAEVALHRPSGATAYTGSGQVPMSVLRLPDRRRGLVVYSPDLIAPDMVDIPEPGVLRRQAALIARSRARLAAAGSTLTERVAAGTAP